ncbi:hypothetical protein DOM21_02480 [Bacteriovorax stolpii]|uniref:Uncharacterized protein n=1 Tax=Bacteriovorax stolpii TaxID=960 RepID=A0A2K9NX66_BACTC|nr:hypothetical protein [Bacteriovorax stolpii]AUN99665.1 hypothetical protein C0V70_16435 [Bacteriovorax stolpii]QDK40338.1 hypothetical protein DOM21_02480 [Bacteriovorax stolpii]TDP51297.1 hypothetical protein C8D79_3469 [Bacteriovorax stolpii]
MKTIITFCILLLSLNSFAAVLKHETSKARYDEYPFREVCEKLGAKNFELIEAKSMSEIDCMGKVYQAIDFCLNKFPLDKTLSRAIVDEKTKMVKCEHSESVMISVSCDERDLKYCFDPKKGCDELKKIYANRLDVAHFSMLEKNINCYFAKKIGESFNEDP